MQSDGLGRYVSRKTSLRARSPITGSSPSAYTPAPSARKGLPRCPCLSVPMRASQTIQQPPGKNHDRKKKGRPERVDNETTPSLKCSEAPSPIRFEETPYFDKVSCELPMYDDQGRIVDEPRLINQLVETIVGACESFLPRHVEPDEDIASLSDASERPASED